MENIETIEQFSFEKRIDLSPIQNGVQQIKNELRKVIVGQDNFIELLIVSILSNGHSLIEGVPGVAKTITAKLLAQTLDCEFSRIQFTPDLMPADVLGTSIFNAKTQDFEFKKGPIFSNIILIDEINRAPAKTQAALFECMAERQITVDGHTYKLDFPFLVFATQNPIEQEGTYQLPEAQLDRFLFKIEVNYPTLEDEQKILLNEHERENKILDIDVNKIFSPIQIKEFQNTVKQIKIEENLIYFIAKVINNTRNNPFLFLGASPRASLSILIASKAMAAIRGRDFVLPEDIKKVAIPILRHRIIVSPEKEMEGVSAEQVATQILDSTEIPR